MADVYTHAFNFAAGQTQPLEFDLGPPAGAGDPERTLTTAQPAPLYRLRVGYLANLYPAAPLRFFGSIRLPDSGMRIEGIEVPFLLDVEAPVTLVITPSQAVPAAFAVLGSISKGCCGGDYESQRTEAVAAPGNTPLQPWAIAVFVHNTAATAEFLDSTGASLGVFPPGVEVPRPRLATQVRITTANSLVTQFFAL